MKLKCCFPFSNVLLHALRSVQYRVQFKKLVKGKFETFVSKKPSRTRRFSKFTLFQDKKLKLPLFDQSPKCFCKMSLSSVRCLYLNLEAICIVLSSRIYEQYNLLLSVKQFCGVGPGTVQANGFIAVISFDEFAGMSFLLLLENGLK